MTERHDWTCDDTEERFADFLGGHLDGPAAGRLEAHLARCADCRREADELGRLWRDLGLVPEELPGPDLRRRFYGALEEAIAEEEAAGTGDPMRAAGAPTAAGTESRRSHHQGRAPDSVPAPDGATTDGGPLRFPAPRRPAAATARFLRVAAALALLAVGLLAGLALRSPNGAGEIAALRGEVQALHRTVALSLLAQRSASDRLQGVAYGRRAAGDDQRVVDALIETMASDPSVNVRLAAIDALAGLAARPAVRSALADSLPRQGSPLVQVALVDTLLATDAPEAEERLRRLLAGDELSDTAREHLARNLT